MGCTIRDERNEEERSRLKLAVVMTDSFMSGWGGAEGGASYAAWACTPGDFDQVYAWVKSRSDAKRVRVVTDINRYRPRGAKHLSIYAVGEGHRALEKP